MIFTGRKGKNEHGPGCMYESISEYDVLWNPFLKIVAYPLAISSPMEIVFPYKFIMDGIM